MQFYFWNVTNANDVINSGAKPNVALAGPYSYLEKRIKWGIEWSDDSEVMTYRYNRTFKYGKTHEFVSFGSHSMARSYIETACTEVGSTEPGSFPADDVIIAINPCLMGVIATLEE